MDRVDAKPEVVVSPEHESMVQNITDIDRISFNGWYSDPAKKGDLYMPLDVLRYVMIPQRILELAEDPAQVGVVEIEDKPKIVRALVIEHKRYGDR